MNARLLIVPLICAAMLSSCIGVSADISIRANGSGTIALEYRVSRMAESLGRLDGNERWQTVPVGRADLQRSIDRIPGMRIASFSTKNDGGGDLITKTALEFASIDALLAFLDASGTQAAYSQEGATKRIRLRLLDAQDEDSAVDPDLLLLLKDVSHGYEIRLSFNTPASATLSLHDSAGNKIEAQAIDPAARVVPSGRKVSLSTGTGELFALTDGLEMEIVW